MLCSKDRQATVWEFSYRDCKSCFAKNGLLLTESGGNECRWSCPESIGCGGFTWVRLREGFELWITDCLLHRDIVCNQSITESGVPRVHLGFCLEGYYTGTWDDGRNQFILRSGEHYFFLGDEYRSHGVIKQGVHLFTVSLIMTPELLLSYFNDEGAIQDVLMGIEQQCETTSFFRMENMTVDMNLALRQIIGCSYSGASRKLYLESRCLELMAYQFQQFSGMKVPVSKDHSNSVIHPSEKGRIERVCSMLLDNLETPPNLDDLAAAAGMSHPKLNRCFRQLYGKTVFQYLRQERLKKARMLIENQGRTVTEAAYMVGYSSLSHFSKAYKHHYGISPGTEYRSRKTA